MRKSWDGKKLSMAVIMLAPSSACGIECDSTTMLVLNNALRLGYGKVSVLNLFAEIDDYKLKRVEEADNGNLKVIVDECAKADVIVYAPGVGKAQNKLFQKRQEQVLNAIDAHKDKLRCLCNEKVQFTRDYTG